MEISWNFVSPKKWEPCSFGRTEYMCFFIFLIRIKLRSQLSCNSVYSAPSSLYFLFIKSVIMFVMSLFYVFLLLSLSGIYHGQTDVLSLQCLVKMILSPFVLSSFRVGHTGIEVALSTANPDGLIVWMGNSQTDYLALGMRDGILQLE